MGLLYLIALGFLAAVLVAVELSPPRARWPLVLLASVVFLAAFARLGRWRPEGERRV